MSKLEWERWYRSDGCRKWMDRTLFAGTSFTDIFYQAMRLVFLDEKKNPGLLYKGLVGKAAEDVVKQNGKRYGFNASDQLSLLQLGMFKYDDNDFLGPLKPGGRLRFEGPDASEMATTYGSAPVGGGRIDINFYNIIEDARTGTGSFRGAPIPETASGVTQLAYFTGAIVLHEIMHNHGFKHPETVDWTPGSDYASSLPYVAFRSTLNATKAQLGSTSLPLMQVKLPQPVTGKSSAQVQGLIKDKWVALGSEAGLLGSPMTNELSTPDGVGRYNHFQGGSIYWTPQTGAWEVHGLIREKWASLGWERSALGYPTSDEYDLSSGGRVSDFQHGQITWSPSSGARVLAKSKVFG